MRPVGAAAVIGDRDLAPPRQGIDGDEQSGRAVADVFAIAPLDLARSGRQGLADFADQLLGGFVQAHHGMPGIGRPVRHVQHVFHVIDEVSIRSRRDAPHLPQMWFKFVCCNVVRTVSWDTFST